MRVLITGATGFVGRALVARLLRDGHQVTAWVRDAERARSKLGAEVRLALAPRGEPGDALVTALSGTDAVVNLAGENLFGGRWTTSRRRRIESSRVDLTAGIVDALQAASPRPAVLVSASAVGFYGDRGDEELDDDAPPGTGFLADLTGRWEAAALHAEEAGVRVAVLRAGLVLGAEGGALGRLAPLFRWGLGGRLGSGRQYTAWIHLHDLAELIVWALGEPRAHGCFNATAPDPVTNRDFTRALAHALGRRALLAVPGPILRLALGEASSVLLGGQRVLPRRLQSFGFRFAFPSLEGALEDLLGQASQPQISRCPPSSTERFDGVRPRHLLTQSTLLPGSLDEVFRFFSQARNLGLITPPWTGFQIVGDVPDPLSAGATLAYRLKLGPARLRWLTEIVAWEPAERFVDRQLKGPYRLWWHEHRFFAEGSCTRMEDSVHYALPLGPLGAVAQPFFVAPTLRRIFAFRRQMIRLRFGACTA